MEVARSLCLKSRAGVAGVLFLSLWSVPSSYGQLGANRQIPDSQGQNDRPNDTLFGSDKRAEDELNQGTVLTSKGAFKDAIPHLLAAQGRVANQYAAGFNLALCYVATNQFTLAIKTLHGVSADGHSNADVQNLLAQAYIGNGQSEEGFKALKKAAAFNPQNEKVFLYAADACMGRRNYALGLKVVDLGLHSLPQSARLHYERGILLSQVDEFDRAKSDFALVRKLAAESEVGYLAAAYEELYSGNMPETIEAAREGIRKGFGNYTLLTILGEALMRSGVTFGQPEFSEAQIVLEKAVVLQPNDPNSQITLGKFYLLAGRLNDAIAHLEIARELAPEKPAVYANLAKAYQRRGNAAETQDALMALAALNQAQAEKIGEAPGDRKAGYSGGGVEQGTAAQH
jgi:predicted Zn-dependent protease